MTSAAWIALAALGLALLGHVITVTIYLTKVHMRLLNTEKQCDAMSGVGDRLVRLETHVDSVLEEVRRINVGLDWLRPLAADTPPPPVRRRKPSE